MTGAQLILRGRSVKQYLADCAREDEKWDRHRIAVYRQTGKKLGCAGCGGFRGLGDGYRTGCGGCGLAPICISCQCGHHCQERQEMKRDLEARGRRVEVDP